MRTRPTFIICLVTCAIGLLAPTPVLAHTPPPVYLTSELDSEELLITCVIGEELFKDWLGFDPADWEDLAPEQVSAYRESIEDFIAEWCTVTADGILVKGLFRGLEAVTYEDHGQEWKFVHVKLAYGMKGMPTQLSLAWKRFKNSIGWWLEYIQAEIIAEGFGGMYFEFSEEEPEYTWHRPATPQDVPAMTEPSYVPPAAIPVPLVSVGILLALLIALPFFRAYRVPRPWCWGSVAGCVLLTVAFLGVARVEVHPPWQARFKQPSRAEALQIFRSLHRNIYRAFDYTRDEDVYDTLARSVKGRLLDRIYIEMHEGLIMRDQGGAVSRIQGVRITEAEVELPTDSESPEFDVICTWQVRGRVSHWGHTHERVNEYQARYRVESDGRKWRIADVETLDQRRLDDEEAARTWDEPEGG